MGGLFFWIFFSVVVKAPFIFFPGKYPGASKPDAFLTTSPTHNHSPANCLLLARQAPITLVCSRLAGYLFPCYRFNFVGTSTPKVNHASLTTPIDFLSAVVVPPVRLHLLVPPSKSHPRPRPPPPSSDPIPPTTSTPLLHNNQHHRNPPETFLLISSPWPNVPPLNEAEPARGASRVETDTSSVTNNNPCVKTA